MKKIFINLYLIIVMGCSYAFAQPAFPGAGSKSDSLRNEGDILGAIAECKKVYEQNSKDFRNVYNYAKFLSVNKQIDSCFKYLNIAIEMEASIAPMREPDFLSARSDKRWVDFENRLIGMLRLKPDFAVKDIEYAKVLWKLAAYDQAYFLETGIAGRKLGFKSSVVEAIWALKFMVQEKSQKELVEWIDKKGWPRKSEVGDNAAIVAWYVIMHSNAELQSRYLPTIKQMCAENELTWDRYARIYDRCLFNQKKPQKYGTHTFYNEKTKTEDLYPLEDETMVNEWRKEVGLPQLEKFIR
jgi:hypothetical protein